MISYGHSFFGGIAQLVERLNGIQKVRSSTLLTSTIKKETKKRPGPRPGLFCCPDPTRGEWKLGLFSTKTPKERKALALHRSAYGLTTVPIPCVTVPSWKIELLFMAFHPSPRRGALFSVAVEGLSLRACTLCSPFSRGGIVAPSPKHGVRSPPCPYRPPGRTCALRTRTARPCAALYVSLCFFVSFVIAAQR